MSRAHEAGAHAPELPALSSTQHAISGAAAGLVATTLTYPLDLVKTRLQVQDGWSSTARYRGTFHTLKLICKCEGASSLYSGLSAGILGSSIAWGGYFFVYHICKRHVQPAFGANTPLANISAAMIAGTATAVITNPFWLLKTRMQLDVVPLGSRTAPKTARQVAQRTFEADGLRGFFRGLAPSLFLVPQGALQMMVYEELKKLLQKHKLESKRRSSSRSSSPQAAAYVSSLESMAMGALSKMISLSITYPLQVVRSRLQRTEQSTLPGGSRPYKGTVDALRKIVQREGLSGYYKGFGTNLVKVVPTSAITFVTYEYVAQIFRDEGLWCGSLDRWCL